MRSLFDVKDEQTYFCGSTRLLFLVIVKILQAYPKNGIDLFATHMYPRLKGRDLANYAKV